MKPSVCALLIALATLTACNKAATPTASSTQQSSPPSKAPDAVQQKLQQYSGTPATSCGRLDAKASQIELKAASVCAQLANEKKERFFVAYDMPGMTVGVAGNSDGKLFTVQSQGSDPSAALTAGDCPSQLRVASSGRVTCFAPGDMGSMGAGHSAGAIPPGMANPHAPGKPNPHAATKVD